MKNYKITNNYLSTKHLNTLNKVVLSNNFPWFIQEIDESFPEYKQFVHIFFKDNNFSSPHVSIIKPFLKKILYKKLIRIKINLLTQTNKIIDHPYHIDSNVKNSMTSIFYLNTNNGYTKIKNKDKIISKKNTLLTFPSSWAHHGTTCTNKEYRIVLNIVYER
jgi:hypothetical protein